MNDQLVRYLETITGEALRLKLLTSDQVAGLPVLLVAGFRFAEWGWHGQSVVLAQPQDDTQPGPWTRLQATHQILCGHFGKPVVYVFDALDGYFRNRLTQSGVPFIVPGRQLFLPPFASLCERFPRAIKAATLSAAAQVTVLFQLLRPPEEGSLLVLWADWLGYSAMTLTKVRDELVAHGLCLGEAGAKPRGLRFLHQPRALWETARRLFRSPVRRVQWVQFRKTMPPLCVAGSTALSRDGMLEDDPVPTYACSAKAWRNLVARRVVEPVGHPEQATARIECWRYDPGLLAEGGVVDRLSLFLSLAESPEERVRLAAGALLEGLPW